MGETWKPDGSLIPMRSTSVSPRKPTSCPPEEQALLAVTRPKVPPVPALEVNVNVVLRGTTSTSVLPPSVDRSSQWRRARNVWVVVRLSIGAATGCNDGADAERTNQSPAWVWRP